MSDPELPNIEIRFFWLHRSIDCWDWRFKYTDFISRSFVCKSATREVQREGEDLSVYLCQQQMNICVNIRKRALTVCTDDPWCM